MMEIPANFSLRSYDGRQAAHSHPHDQIVLSEKGLLEIDVAGCQGRVDQGCAALIRADQAHSFRGFGDNRFVVVDLPGRRGQLDRYMAPDWDPAGDRAFLAVDAGLRHLVGFFAGELRRGSPDAATSDHWAGALSRALAERGSGPATALPRQVRAALGFMQANLSEPLTVEDIARAANASASHLSALFRRALGESVWRRLTALRVEAACRLLEENDAGLAEVALRTGFSDQSALTRAMGRRLGVTPGAYRARLIGSDRRIRP